MICFFYKGSINFYSQFPPKLTALPSQARKDNSLVRFTEEYSSAEAIIERGVCYPSNELSIGDFWGMILACQIANTRLQFMVANRLITNNGVTKDRFDD